MTPLEAKLNACQELYRQAWRHVIDKEYRSARVQCQHLLESIEALPIMNYATFAEAIADIHKAIVYLEDLEEE